MADSKHDDEQGKDAGPPTTANGSGGQTLRQKLLAALVELDFAYEHERTKIENSPDIASKAKLLQKLKERHRQQRQPYIRKLALFQEGTTSEASIRSIPASSGKLSSPEAEILRFVMQGTENDVVAAETGLAEAAVREHIKSILRKVRTGNSHPSLVTRAGTSE